MNGLDVFRHDLRTGETELVSVSSDGWQGNRRSWSPNVSADGRTVTFLSWNDLDNHQPNPPSPDGWHLTDVYIRDMRTGTTTRIHESPDGERADGSTGSASKPALSYNGQIIAFVSAASNLVDDDTNNTTDIFVHHRHR